MIGGDGEIAYEWLEMWRDGGEGTYQQKISGGKYNKLNVDSSSIPILLSIKWIMSLLKLEQPGHRPDAGIRCAWAESNGES